MTEIDTLLGPVDADEIGIVAMHEHLLYGLHGWQWAPEFNFDRALAFETIRDELIDFKEAGGSAIVDVSGATNGRDVNFYARLSERTGVHMIAATGFKNQKDSIPGHFLGRAYRATTDSALHWLREIPGSFYPSHGESMEYLMFLLLNELTEGMAAPGMVRTKMKASLVRTGSGWDDISHLEDFSLRGAAVAAVKCGKFVLLEGINQVARQLEIMAEYDVPANRIIIGNCDDGRAIDPDRDIELAKKGHFVAYDHVGWEGDSSEQAISDDQRVEMVKNIIDAGLAERLILSSSAIGYALGGTASPQSLSYLLKNFIPRLQQAGVGDDAINTILVSNPKTLLTGV